jgi:hypothetical protein
MCNCGGRRAILTSQLSAPPHDARRAPRMGDDNQLVSLVALTLNSFVIRGPATGRHYRFLPRAVLRVDARDVAGLLSSGRVRRSG